MRIDSETYLKKLSKFQEKFSVILPVYKKNAFVRPDADHGGGGSTDAADAATPAAGASAATSTATALPKHAHCRSGNVRANRW
jgi:hypothetical protein